jgi:NAD(P)-dependent dehydrogenase (short-subunit alcohol dehydrogenase family)
VRPSVPGVCKRSRSSKNIKVNCARPGYVATDLNHHCGPSSVAQGAEIIVRLATLVDDGSTAGFFNEEETVPW